jgi:hypothetical protein
LVVNIQPAAGFGCDSVGGVELAAGTIQTGTSTTDPKRRGSAVPVDSGVLKLADLAAGSDLVECVVELGDPQPRLGSQAQVQTFPVVQVGFGRKVGQDVSDLADAHANALRDAGDLDAAGGVLVEAALVAAGAGGRDEPLFLIDRTADPLTPLSRATSLTVRVASAILLNSSNNLALTSTFVSVLASMLCR